MPDNRLIALCDILGFRNLVMNRDLDELMTGEWAVFHRLLAFSVVHGEVPELPPALLEIRSRGNVGLAWFSDTILVYARDDNDLSCRNVLEVVGWLLFTTMTTPTRIRAGVAYGQFRADASNDLYIGPAVVEAYELEQEQSWAGAALTERAASRLPDRTSTGERYQWWVCEYPVPLKRHNPHVRCSNLAVDWTQGIHVPFDLHWSPSYAEPTQQDRDADPGRHEKWVNTRRFHKEVCISCFPANRNSDRLKVI